MKRQLAAFVCAAALAVSADVSAAPPATPKSGRIANTLHNLLNTIGNFAHQLYFRQTEYPLKHSAWRRCAKELPTLYFLVIRRRRPLLRPRKVERFPT